MQKLRLQGLALAQKLAPVVATLTRLSLGMVFVQSGWGKLHNLEKVTSYFTSLGIPAAQLQAPFVATMEFLCGLALLLGLLTRLASLPIIIMMFVAIITAKREGIESWTDIFTLAEFLYIVLATWLIAYGPGPLSLDHFVAKRWPVSQTQS
jgi:putative oxidoreductase